MQEGGGQQDTASEIQQTLDHNGRSGIRLALRPPVAAVQQEGNGAADGAGAEQHHHGGDLGYQYPTSILILLIMVVVVVVIVIVVLPLVTCCPTASGLIDLQEALEEIIHLRLIHLDRQPLLFCFDCFRFNSFCLFGFPLIDLSKQLKHSRRLSSSRTTYGQKQATLLAKTAACVALGISIDWVVGWVGLIWLGWVLHLHTA